ncbi:MAG TPA: hypothetical protein VK712_03970 [Verrucomicrobiae bacterium]|jgi:hypothetical protein|nr:hypothetical protein [Verrucomicrobiae bacterium]
MTRLLSELLQAREPFFRQGLKRLEAANGHPNTDIRFSTELTQATQSKLRELGLDPRDTTAEELYHVLQSRLEADDARLIKTLRTHAALHISAEGDVIAGMIHALKELPDSKRCFALKASAIRTIIKKLPPKKAMKQLGYRSLDSFLKHETAVSALAAAWLSEGAHWRQRLLEQYKHLQPGDFEDRNIVMVQPDSRRWRQLAANSVEAHKHNLISFKELGALVFLPLPAEVPAGTTTASLVLALHELNETRAGSTFLKLCQVRPDFGSVVQTVASGEPHLSSRLLDQPVPWHLIQRYYAQLAHHGREEAFEPHVQLEDIAWHPVEQALSAVEPSFDFWRQTAHLGLLHQRQPVSLNVADAALNCCNKLPFERRVAQYFKGSLWHELMLRYLQREPVEQSVLAELQPQLAAEMVLA